MTSPAGTSEFRSSASSALRIAPVAADDDRQWLADLWERAWSGLTMATRGRTVALDQLWTTALIAWRGDTRAGAITWHPDPGTSRRWEVISLNADPPGLGTGTVLLATVEQRAHEARIDEILIVTTNDNLAAFRFYQRRGYRFVTVRPGAVDEARRQKPSIPTIGLDGIPLRDELVLSKRP